VAGIEHEIVQADVGRAQTVVRALDAALAAALALLTLAVALGWWPVSLDRAVEVALPPLDAGGATGVLVQVADRLTHLASPVDTAVLTLVAAAMFGLVRGSWAPVRFAGIRVVVLAVTVLGGKALLHRPGPLQPQVRDLHGYFPSGHTTTALVCTFTVAALLAAHRPRWRRHLLAAAGGWTALVGAGLVLHRYHWPTDVVGALLLGALVVRWTPAYHPAPGAAAPVPRVQDDLVRPRGTAGAMEGCGHARPPHQR